MVPKRRRVHRLGIEHSAITYRSSCSSAIAPAIPTRMSLPGSTWRSTALPRVCATPGEVPTVLPSLEWTGLTLAVAKNVLDIDHSDQDQPGGGERRRKQQADKSPEKAED